MKNMQSCKKCGVEKPLDEFHKCKNKANGVTSTCKPCAIEKARKWHSENKDRHAISCKQYREKNKDILLKRTKEFAAKNPEKVKSYKEKWKKNNVEIVRIHARTGYYKNIDKIKQRKKEYLKNNKAKTNSYQRFYRSNTSVKLNINIGNQLRQTMLGMKKGKKWFEIVGYDVSALTNRLQSLFADGMSFDNYGAWHIDHIRPISSFDFSKNPFDVAKECWDLSNLQPLWAKDNLQKGSRW